MTTPLIMLGLLSVPALLARLVNRMAGHERLSLTNAACLGITLVFCFTGIGHFIKTEPMARMLPAWIPSRVPLVYVTGLFEIAAALAILIPRHRQLVGWGLILMLIAFLPVNVYAALHRVEMGGHEWGPSYLLIRIPLQVALITWIWWFAIRSGTAKPVSRGP